MKAKLKIIFIIVCVVWLFGLLAVYLNGSNFAIFNPKGEVAEKQFNLILLTIGLGLFVLLPVYFLTFYMAWNFREGRNKHKYAPEQSGNTGAELVWWGIPTVIILVLSVITWQTSHSLDPHKPLGDSQPLKVQVIALDWKWLFIYPEEKVASINQLQIPVNREIAFDITADAPMNSFWIPQLGGQIYAMPGMTTKLHLKADTPGDYPGSSANLSGKGFSGMNFITKANSEEAFSAWIRQAAASDEKLDEDSYYDLAKPSENVKPASLSLADERIFEKAVMKYAANEGEH